MSPGSEELLDCGNMTDVNNTYGNTTNSTCGGDFNQFIMPWWRQVVWTLIYIALVIVATGGNLIVIWIVLAHKQMRTITNFFLVNLAVSDCMMSLMNITFNFVYFLNSHWPFGEAYCKIVQFVSVLSVTASVFTLVAISVDRYSAIMHPLKPRMSRSWTLLVTIIIWVMSAVLAAPNYLLSQTYTFVYNDGDIRTLCYLTWPDGETMESTLEAVYNGAIFVLTYFLPLTATTYCYTRMSVELWGSQSIGEATPVQIESVNSKRRVVKMMIVLVAIFAVCWLPYQVYFLVIPLFSELTHEPIVQEVFLGIYWLAMSNSMYNPIIYYWMNSR
ncbi:tachykinin-like peptides receptor 99D isoform X2 [Amphibalanus amphitrite]|nr:tachykinin-like peptides receptor 99D isoform X2 [Amphibalanus amphitrite]